MVSEGLAGAWPRAMLRNAAQCCAMLRNDGHKTRDARKHGRAALPWRGVKKSERSNKHRTATHTEQLRSNAAGPRTRREVPASAPIVSRLALVLLAGQLEKERNAAFNTAILKENGSILFEIRHGVKLNFAEFPWFSCWVGW